MSSTRVSVIIIFFNAETFFEEAIQSVFAQTCQDWELLLVDDGSTDRGTEIALRYVKQYPQKVRYFEHERHENRGMSASRNLGIRNARGDYIAFLDADDVWLANKLEEQVAILDAQPEAAMVYGATQYWYSWMGRADDMQRDFVPELGVEPNTLIQPPVLLTLSLKSKAPTPCPSDILVRREIVEGIGGFQENFRGRYQLFEDQAFLAKLYLRAPVFVASNCWFKYRQHSQSCVSAAEKAGQKHSIGLFYFDWLEGYLTKQGINDARLWQALRNKRWRYKHPRLSRLSNHARNRVLMKQEVLRSTARHILPTYIHRWLRAHWHNSR